MLLDADVCLCSFAIGQGWHNCCRFYDSSWNQFTASRGDPQGTAAAVKRYKVT